MKTIKLCTAWVLFCTIPRVWRELSRSDGVRLSQKGRAVSVRQLGRDGFSVLPRSTRPGCWQDEEPGAGVYRPHYSDTYSPLTRINGPMSVNWAGWYADFNVPAVRNHATGRRRGHYVTTAWSNCEPTTRTGAPLWEFDAKCRANGASGVWVM